MKLVRGVRRALRRALRLPAARLGCEHGLHACRFPCRQCFCCCCGVSIIIIRHRRPCSCRERIWLTTKAGLLRASTYSVSSFCSWLLILRRLFRWLCRCTLPPSSTVWFWLRDNVSPLAVFVLLSCFVDMCVTSVVHPVCSTWRHSLLLPL